MDLDLEELVGRQNLTEYVQCFHWIHMRSCRHDMSHTMIRDGLPKHLNHLINGVEPGQPLLPEIDHNLQERLLSHS